MSEERREAWDDTTKAAWGVVEEAAEKSPMYNAVVYSALQDLRARLDAADPLRNLLPEVLEALEKIRAFTGHVDSTEEEVTEAWKLSKDLLTKLRTFHPATGGTDDGE